MLASLIDKGADIGAIAAHLDALDPAARADQVRQLGRHGQRLLYVKAGQAPPLDLDYFVGPAGALVEVIHDGLNTLPLPRPLRRFQKRFCRPDGGAPRLFGYNEGPTRSIVGPGYFVAVPTAGQPRWESRGAVVIDYFQVPDGAVADGWPPIVPNEWRLQRFVYHETRDFMRRVSTHVSIGAAFKRERPLDHYFVLCRRDPSGSHAAA
ncbi:MAG TPA: hypothetical protein VNO33_22060 [Kofleriaceae bacterium]|nr:hypothetical protein [Kofleriaceae bacterium]